MVSRITVFRHAPGEGAGSLFDVFDERSCQLRFVNTPRTNLVEFDPLSPTLLVVMGGPIGAYQTDDYPFLNDEIYIIKERIKYDMPTIGICLGAQLIAKALGANVYPGEQGKERGWFPLRMTGEAIGTPFQHLAGPSTSMFHWHGDTFDLPQGAKLIASSDLYENQIFTYGENICGLQCHPEVTEDLLREWFVMLTSEVSGENAEVPLKPLREQTFENAETLRVQTSKFLNEWMDLKGI